MIFPETRFALPDFQPACAEIFVLFMICLILMTSLFIKEKARGTLHFLAQAALIGAAALTCTASGAGTVKRAFSGMFVADMMADLLKLAIYLTISLTFFYSRAYVAGKLPRARGEYYALTLIATLGMMVVVSAGNFVTLYVGLELLSLPIYALVALERDSSRAAEAAMKYFVLGALASAFMLYGISMIYGATGTLDISAVAEGFSRNRGDRATAVFGLVFLVSGIAFKLGLAPFHMWVPDVYHGAPLSVALLISSAPKIAVFAFAVRVLINGLFPLSQDWRAMLLALVVLSMALGNLAAIAQTNFRRMLAYSSISHMGFMLLGLVSGVIDGNAKNMINAVSASMFYLLTYVLSSAGAFGVLVLLPDPDGDSGEISGLAGLGKRSPVLAATMMTLMFSMAGIPFFAGFFAKFSVLVAVVAAGSFWLAALAVFFSLVGAYYYLRIVKVMYFDPLPDGARNIETPFSMKVLVAANGLAVALLGIFPNALMFLCVKSLSFSVFA
ncbi:MAG: NADH-quinone oxidoreductase subunit NuoN [Candidatus Accumulibacter sp.]|jgi:NADH-quinone oxidoreductase subunit N|nr:NADH-quinone oxidoreductase subunit NuoN [Accumulibacter sp.]